MLYNCELFVLSIVTWNYHCLLRIIISYLKLYNYVQTNNFYWIEIIAWNHILISIRQKYLKPYNGVQIISIRRNYWYRVFIYFLFLFLFLFFFFFCFFFFFFLSLPTWAFMSAPIIRTLCLGMSRIREDCLLLKVVIPVSSLILMGLSQ